MADQLIGAELRQHPRTRIPAPFPCSFLPVEVPSWWNGSSHGLGVVFDLSLNGVKLMSETLPPTGEQVALLVRLPHQRAPLAIDMATVRWRTAQVFGLEFTAMSESAAMRLRRYLEDMLPDRTDSMHETAPGNDNGRDAADVGDLSFDPMRPRAQVEDLGQRESMTERVSQEQPIAEVLDPVSVPVARAREESVSKGASLKPGVAQVRSRRYRTGVRALVRWGMFAMTLLVLSQAWWKSIGQPPLPRPIQSVRPSAVSASPLVTHRTEREETASILEPQTGDPGYVTPVSLNVRQAEPERGNAGVESESSPTKIGKESPSPADANPLFSSQQPLMELRRPASPVAAQVVAGQKAAVPPALKGRSRSLAPVPASSGSKAGSASRAAASPQPRSRDASHFTVVFEGEEDPTTWMRMRAILDYAYGEISQKFGYVPGAPIKVVVHMNQQFSGETGTPAWADTLFDQASGAVHIPAGRALDDLAWFSRVVRHEFVHALLYAQMTQQLSAAPAWLVEGLAIGLAEDSWSDLDEAKQRHRTFLPLRSLQERWSDIPADSLSMAYLEADLATRSLTERYGMYGVRQVLNVVRTGQSFDSAMEEKLSLSYDTFQRQWANGATLALRPDLS